jgi:divalent metal cation (Fe/Co/Zn/Cd) transporter
MVMLETLAILVVAMLIVMPVVAILLMGLQRVLRQEWPPGRLAMAASAITLALVLAYFVLT